MGNSNSRTIKKAIDCKYNKTDFMLKLNILKNAYEVSTFYGNEFASYSPLPSRLIKYLNYNDITEQFFNTTRKDDIEELIEINSKIRNYYDFYIALNSLNVEYENPNLTENERRIKLKIVFEISYKIVELLIQELSISCSSQ